MNYIRHNMDIYNFISPTKYKNYDHKNERINFRSVCNVMVLVLNILGIQRFIEKNNDISLLLGGHKYYLAMLIIS